MSIHLQGTAQPECVDELHKRWTEAPLGFSVLLAEMPDFRQEASADLIFMCGTFRGFHNARGYGLLDVAHASWQVHIRTGLLLLPSNGRKRAQLSDFWSTRWAIVAVSRKEMEAAARDERAPTCSAMHLCGSLAPPSFGPWTMSTQLPRMCNTHMAWTVKCRTLDFACSGEEDALVFRRHEKWIVPELLAMELQRLLVAGQQQPEEEEGGEAVLDAGAPDAALEPPDASGALVDRPDELSCDAALADSFDDLSGRTVYSF